MLDREVNIKIYKPLTIFDDLSTFKFSFAEEDTKDKGKLYKHTSKLASLAESFSTKPGSKTSSTIKSEPKESKDKTLLKKDKKKSNLEMFKEELRA